MRARRCRYCLVALALFASADAAGVAQFAPRSPLGQRSPAELLSGAPRGYSPVSGGAARLRMREAAGHRRRFRRDTRTGRVRLEVRLWDADIRGFGSRYVAARLAARRRAPAGWHHRALRTILTPTQSHVVEIYVAVTGRGTRAPGVDDLSGLWPELDLNLRGERVARGLDRDRPPDAEYLVRRLLPHPPRGAPRIMLPGRTGPTRQDLTCPGGVRSPLAAVGRRSREAGLRWRGQCRQWGDPEDGTTLTVALVDAGTGWYAGPLLRSLTQRWRSLPRAPDWFLTAFTESELDGVVVAGRQGPFLTYAVAARPSALAGRMELPHLAAAALRRQLERLPAGATEPVDTPAWVVLQLRFAGAIAVLLAGYGLLRFGWGWLVRRRTRLAAMPPEAAGVVAVADRARRLRRAGLLMGAAILASSALALGTLGAPLWLSPVGVAGLVAILGTVRIRRRAERPVRVPSLAHREPRWSAVVLAVAAVFILVATISLTIGVAGQFALADAGRLVDGEPSGIDDNLVTLASVLAALLAANTLHRVARWQWRVRASELGSYDPRDALLYLRGFSDDRLKVPRIVSARLPLLELAAPVARDSFEAVVVWELEAVGPVVAIAAPQGDRRGAGAVQEDVLPDFWQSQVRVRMGKRPVVALSLGCSAGVLWEVSELARRCLLDRTLLIFPPVGDDELRERWRAVAGRLRALEVPVDELPADSAAVLVAAFLDRQLVVFTADYRDEAGYRAALGEALRSLAAGSARSTASGG